MGVPGLWDYVQKAGTSRSLTNIAVVDGFQSNSSRQRAYRIGIDASLWFAHAQTCKNQPGENPELRTLFFKVKALADLPFLPLFVFDGRDRPKVKRGSKMGKSGSHALSKNFKTILDAFGMEWREAKAEAEAELAYLNRRGFLDAVMTDDIDAFIFGATTVIRNHSSLLSGNKKHPALNREGKPSEHHAMVFTADSIRTHPEVGLTKGGMILFALLSGGDYDTGVEKFGKITAYALARAGFGDQLVDAYERSHERPIQDFLVQWRAAVTEEVQTNSRGFLPRQNRSAVLPPTFPDLNLLKSYCSPKIHTSNIGPRDKTDMNLGRLAGLVEDLFREWGYERMIVKRFRDIMWEAAVIRLLRRSVLQLDEKERHRRRAAGHEDWDRTALGVYEPTNGDAVGTHAALIRRWLDAAPIDRHAEAFVNRRDDPITQAIAPTRAVDDPHPLILKVVGTRQHVSTDYLLEYRVEVSPVQLVELTRAGIKGTVHDPGAGAELPGAELALDGPSSSQSTQPKSPQKPPPDPLSSMRMWVPVSMMRMAHPTLVDTYEFGQAEKLDKQLNKGSGRGKGKRPVRATQDDEEDGDAMSSSPLRPEAQSTQSASRDKPRQELAQLHVSLAGPSRLGQVAQQAERRPFTFLFTFANPDEPFDLDDENDTPAGPVADSPAYPSQPVAGPSALTAPARGSVNAALDSFEYRFNAVMGGDSNERPAPVPPSQSQNARAGYSGERRKRPRTASPAPPSPSPAPDRHQAMYDQLLGVVPGSGSEGTGRGRGRDRGRGAATTRTRGRGRPRNASARGAAERPATAATKRRRTIPTSQSDVFGLDRSPSADASEASGPQPVQRTSMATSRTRGGRKRAPGESAIMQMAMLEDQDDPPIRPLAGPSRVVSQPVLTPQQPQAARRRAPGESVIMQMAMLEEHSSAPDSRHERSRAGPSCVVSQPVPIRPQQITFGEPTLLRAHTTPPQERHDVLGRGSLLDVDIEISSDEESPVRKDARRQNPASSAFRPPSWKDSSQETTEIIDLT